MYLVTSTYDIYIKLQKQEKEEKCALCKVYENHSLYILLCF